MRGSHLTLSTSLHALAITAAILSVHRWSAPERPRAVWVEVHQPETVPVVESRVLEPECVPQVAPTSTSVPLSEPTPPAPLPFEAPDPPAAAPRSASVPPAPHDWKTRIRPEPPPTPTEEQPRQAAVDVEAVPLEDENEPPPYPYLAWRHHQQGTVIVELEIDASGSVTAGRVVQSSGWPLLDEAARQQLLEWHFRPARHEGSPHACRFRQPVVFHLPD